jgi:hypothetical protein
MAILPGMEFHSDNGLDSSSFHACCRRGMWGIFINIAPLQRLQQA